MPVIFDRSVARPGRSRASAERLRGVCIAAGKQSGADFLPAIAPASALGEYLGGLGVGPKLLGDPWGRSDIPAALGHRPDRVGILIGPEGGLTDAEREAVIEAGFQPVRMGRHVLRVETAAIALLAAVVAWTQR